ncbi:YihY/virulence factor BrkB family protein [Fructobacillus americanaquae]|uniref:YihY/virulence factor BrkB family protein n=1 Tax=Fructobacillus americanaquae TaxID=2940302 RepID=A0ABY5C397_9LACO|nr:YihY/virulence factor BrkB family protein [Fructobacillus americanaquae]USS91795.1 YihY/virulence factor BrkB family protein [Fructobacillus americanaquae]
MKKRFKKIWAYLDHRFRADALVTYFTRAQLTLVGPTFAYYVVLTLIPLLIMFVLTIAALNLKTEHVVVVLAQMLPSSIANFLTPIVNSVAHTNTKSYLSFSLIFIAWSLSQVLAVLRSTFNKIADKEEVGLPILSRLWAFLWLIVMLVTVAAIILIGNITALLINHWTGIVIASPTRWLVIIGLWIFLIWVNYRLPVKAARPSFLAVIVGTLIDLSLLMLLNRVFVWFADIQFHRSGVYQSLASIAVFLIWLDLLATILVVGFILMTWLTEFPFFSKDDQEKEKENV